MITRRHFSLIFLVLFSLSMHVFAQIALRLEAEKSRYLCFEPVHVFLTVSNLSGNTLIFNGDTRGTQGSISFKIECSSGRHCKAVASLGNPADELQLAPGESKKLDIIINQFYNFQREDVYNVTAMLDHGRLPRTHVSQPIQITVQDGLPILVKNIGLPSETKDESVIKAIQLSLLRFSDVDEDIYALRAEDVENVYATFRLGPYIDGEKPQLEVDGNSLVHVLVQVRPKLYIYFVFSFHGRNMQLIQKRFYTSADGIPPTLSKSTGYFRVEHARLAREGIDYVEGQEKLQTDETRRSIEH
ncbi:MAG: hypothetical protein II943_09275 [Victivallales bacterium]|nr:hypothetical protein [Victivallales bacterium]